MDATKEPTSSSSSTSNARVRAETKTASPSSSSRSPDSSSSAAVVVPETSVRRTASPASSHNQTPASPSSSSAASSDPAAAATHSSFAAVVSAHSSCQPSASEPSDPQGSTSSHCDSGSASMQRQQQSDCPSDRQASSTESHGKGSVSQWAEGAAACPDEKREERRSETMTSSSCSSTAESRGHKRKWGQGLADVPSSSSAAALSSSSSKAASPSSSDGCGRKDSNSSSGRKHRHHHHRNRRGSSSPTLLSKKSRSGSAGATSSSEKGSTHNSSDSEDEHRMMIDEDAPNDDEVVASPPAAAVTQVPADTLSSKPGSPEDSSSSLKVPPLRIVISKSNSNPFPGSVSTTADQVHSFAQRVSSSTANSSSATCVVGKSVPHLIVTPSATLSVTSTNTNNNNSSSLRDEHDAGVSDDEASNASGASGPTNADGKSNSSRVTRSSQRVKELHQHQDTHATQRSSHHNLRDRGRDKDTDESDTQVTSPTSTSLKDVKDEPAAVAAGNSGAAGNSSSTKGDAITRKRKGVQRTKASTSISGSSSTPEKVTRSADKNLRDSVRSRDTASAEPNVDEDNESTSSSTSSTSGSKESAVEQQSAAGLLKSKEFSVPSYNSYQMYLNIRKAIGKRRKNLMPVQPNPPKGFKNYLMIRGGYLLKDSIPALSANPSSAPSSSGIIPGMASPPADLSPGSALYNLFIMQERERHRLRIQHTIEREKLCLSYEQEILRVHGRAALAVANQTVPYSFCSIIKDDEIYNMIEQENEDITAEAPFPMSKSEASAETRPASSGASSKSNDYSKSTYTNSSTTSTDLTALTGGPSAPGSRSRYNGRLFLSWIQDVTEKWEKIKMDTILRHRRESESLLAIQKLDWEWKMKELLLCDFKTTPLIDRKLIPSVEVCEDFGLLPSASAV